MVRWWSLSSFFTSIFGPNNLEKDWPKKDYDKKLFYLSIVKFLFKCVWEVFFLPASLESDYSVKYFNYLWLPRQVCYVNKMSKRIFIAVICAYYLGISEQCVIKEIIGTYFFAKKTQKERKGITT